MDELIDISYVRLSKEDGDVEDGSIDESCSIQSQRTCIKQYLRSNGFSVDCLLEIVDDGYSGTTMNRPGMNRLIKLVESGKVRTIIVRDLSRFARNYLEAGHYLEFIFPVYNVRFISINDRLDSMELGESTGGLELAIRNLINQMYSKDISRKIKSAVDLKKLSGEFVYGTAPYGYKKGDVRNTIVIDEPAAQVVRQIFEWAAAGITVTNIAQRLNAASISTPSVYLADIRGNYKTRSSWSYESVRNILSNRIYTGDTVPFKSHVVRVGSNHAKQVPPELQQVIPNTHEAIISREQYYQALTVIKSVKKGRGIRSDNPFTSLLICGCCGNRLSKGKEKNKTWLCSMHRYNPKTDCKSVRIDNNQLEQIVLRAISMQCRLLDAKVQPIKRESYSAKSSDQILRNECQSLYRQIDRIQADKMTLYERYACGNITKEGYVSEKDTLSAKEEDLKAQYVMAEQKQALLKEKIRMSADRISAAEKVTPYQSLTKLTPELAKELIKRIIVRPGKSIRIEWNFSDELSGLVEFPEICFEKQAI